MFDGEIYSFGYVSDLDDPMCFRIVNEEEDKIKGTQLKAVVGNGEKNQRFIFKWRDSQGGYSIHPLLKDSMALTLDETSQSVSMAGYNIQDNQIWEVVPSDTCQKVIFRCKHLDTSSSSPKSLYLSYNNEGLLTVSKEKNTSFYLGNPNYSWLRFGEIYFQGIKDKKSDYYRAISNYSNNKSKGLSKTSNSSTGDTTNIYKDPDINLNLILNQIGGNFPKLDFGEITMDKVICEVIGTYNAMCISKGNPENLDFFKLASEFEINAIQPNPLVYVPDPFLSAYEKIREKNLSTYAYTGGLGSQPRKIGDCLDVYNIKNKKIDTDRLIIDEVNASLENSKQCDIMEDKLKNDGAKSAILSYTFNTIRIHTFALRYDLSNSEFVFYNYYTGNETSDSIDRIENILVSGSNTDLFRYFYVGYVLY